MSESNQNENKATSGASLTQVPQVDGTGIYKPTFVKEDPLPIDSSELSYANKLLKASNNGLIPVRLEEDVIIQRISHDLYSNPRSGFRELYNNEARACRIARKNFPGANPRIAVTINPSDRKIVIHGTDSMGMSQQKFLTVYTVLGRSDNFDPSEVGQFGFGRASYTCLSDIMVLETYSRETGERYAVMGKNGIGYNVLPEPLDLDSYGTRITITLRSDIDIFDIRYLVKYVFEVCRFSGVETLINVEGNVEHLDLYSDKYIEAGQYRTGLENMKEYVQKSSRSNNRHYKRTTLLSVEVDDPDFYLYGEIAAYKYSLQSLEGLEGERCIGVYLLCTPVETNIRLPLSSWILNIKDERRYPPTADRERLTEEAEKAVREKVMVALKEKLSTILKLESPSDYVTSKHRAIYLHHNRLDGLSDCLDDRTRKVVEFINTYVNVEVREKHGGNVRIGSLLSRHHSNNLFCVANLESTAAKAIEQNVPGAIVFEGYISELMREFGVRDGNQYVKEHDLKRHALSPTDEVTVYWRRWDGLHTGKVNAADIDDKVIKVPVELRDEYAGLMDGLDVKYRIAVDVKISRNKKLLDGMGVALADLVASVGKKTVTTSEGPMAASKALDLSKSTDRPLVIIKYDDQSLMEYLKDDRTIAVIVPGDDDVYDMRVACRYTNTDYRDDSTLYNRYGGMDTKYLMCNYEDRHAVLHAYYTLRPVDQRLFELFVCAIAGHSNVRTGMSTKQMRDYVFSLAGVGIRK